MYTRVRVCCADINLFISIAFFQHIYHIEIIYSFLKFNFHSVIHTIVLIFFTFS
jgi:hypothetical protein